MTYRRLVALSTTIGITLFGAACSSSGGAASGGSITLMTHDSFATTDGIFAEFETANNVKVDVVKGQDAGVVLNQAILSKGKPEGDVLWGVDNTLLSRALKAKVFAPYSSPALADLDPTLTTFVPSGHEATPVDRGDVCVNVAKASFEGKSLQPPASFDDLADPKYKDQLVVENPAGRRR